MRSYPTRREVLYTTGAAAATVGLAGCMGAPFDRSFEFEQPYDPPALLLTWQRDPTSTMTIDWHTDTSTDREANLEYRRVGADGWEQVIGETTVFEDDDPNTTYSRDVQRVELTGLEPDTDYEFRLGTEPVWSFRTMPETLEEPLTYATGGDTGEGRAFEQFLEVIRERDPMFVSICGDFAIGDGGRQTSSESRWKRWFEFVKTGLVTDRGRVIPVIGGIGNHECREGYVYDATAPFEYENTDEWRRWQAPYFYTFFAFPGQPGYGVLDFGDYLSIPMLDTNHTSPVQGEQTEWLESVLADRTDVAYVFPTYHVPIYPGVDEISDADPPNQSYWPPLFDEYQVTFAFEHHIHHFKRTVPIRDTREQSDGVVYMGNGNLGQMAPSLTDPDRWWVDTAESAYNVHFVTLEPENVRITTVDDNGEQLDSIKRSVDGGPVSEQ